MKRTITAITNMVLIMFTIVSLRAATFYVDSDWTGTESGTASQPWTYLSSSAWSAINSALASGNVTVYFSAREAGSDTDDIYDSNGDGVQDEIDLTYRTDTHSTVLTLDGNSFYNKSDSSPSWVAYAGKSKSRVGSLTAQNSSHSKYSNITLHGLHVATSGGSKEIAICGDNWIVENCECEHTSSSSDGPGILLVPTADSAHEGSSAYAPACNNIIIRNNVVHDTFGESLYIGGGGVMDGSSGAGYPSHSNVTIEGNTIYNCGSRGGQGDGIDVKGGIKNLTIRANEIYNLSGSGTRAIVMQGQTSGSSQTTVIERNRIHDCTGIEDGAIALSDSWGIPQGVNIRNNVISKVNAAGIKVYASQDTVAIYNNTIYSCGDVAVLAYAPVSVMNNLVYGNNGGSSQVSLSGASCDFNAYGGSWGDASVGSSSMNLSATDWGNTVTSASSGDFSLKSSAPVIAKAKVLSGFSNDVMNNSRGTAWDIGGYQHSGGSSTPTLPTVTVTASDANAAEANRDPGVFTITRSGSTSASLTVNYALGGSAGNGTDYNALGSSLTIPAGASSATVTVTPIDDTLVEGAETVSLSLSANAAYTVASPGSATLTIADNDSTSTGDTSAPTVSISGPANNATVSGSAVTVSANASDNVGVVGVQFKLDGANLGAEDSSAPYSVSWNTTSVSSGSHTLSAVARDAAGNRTTSTAVSVLVSNGSTSGTTVAWVDDALPAGAVPAAKGGDTWTWVSSNPTPFSGSVAHQTIIAAGFHQHYFDGATQTLAVNAGDKLFAYVYLDPSNLPSEVMLHWNDGTWDHRAYWGANLIAYGVDGTTGKYYAGALPAAGQWARLEVPASAVALEGSTLKGMGFSLYDGRATWDYAGKSSATTSLPTVSVTASDANAAEANRDPGVFTITRSGSTSASLTVNYALGGSAGNGTDYNALGSSLTIPAGASSATVTVTPIDDTLVEGAETVSLSLSANAAYTVASPGSATVTIADNDSVSTGDTSAPTVSISGPANNATVTGSAVTVSANASDNVGVVGVQFKLDGANLGAEDSSAPYSVSWNTTSVSSGSHTLSAVARDAAGNRTTSAAVTVQVSNGATSGAVVYVDSDWNGTQNGSATQPWKYLSSSAWSAINSALASGNVTVYFSAREAGSDTDDIYDSNGDGVQDAIDLTQRTDTHSTVLTLDGNSKYNTSDSSPNWVSYSGKSKSRVANLTAQNSSHRKYSNITLHGLHVATSGGSKEISICGDNWIVENCECEHTSSSSDGPGILLVPTADSAHEGSSAYAPACNNIIIRNNVVHDTFGESLYIGGGGVMDGSSGAGYPSHSNVTIEGNTIYNCGSRGGQGDGIDVKGGIKNLTIRANEIYNVSGSGTRAIVMQGQTSGSSQTTVIERNRIHDCTGIEDGAIALSDSWGIPQGVNIRNNVIYKVNAAGIKVYASQDTVGIYNNTIASCGSVAILSYAPVSVMNNLVYGNNGGSSQVSLSSGSCDYNAYGGSWGSSSVGSSSMTLSSTQWGSTVTSPSSGDFSLKSGASVIGKAKVLSTFSNDVLNYPRGSSWDIGGYEYGSVATAGASLAEAGTTPASADAVSGSSLASPITRSAKAARIGAQIAPTPTTPTTTTATGDVVWLDDALPAGAQSGVEGGDAWSAVSSDPTPYSGSLARQSSIQAEAQQFFFYGATATLEVNAGDTLFAYVHLDPANPPDEVMLQWTDGNDWEHRTYWGANTILNGTDGTASRLYMGPLPAAGQWVRLEVPASAVALENVTISGMAVILSNGRAAWDTAGKAPLAR